jgi:hypothetical protein
VGYPTGSSIDGIYLKQKPGLPGYVGKMNRFYPKPPVNPAFKLRQPLPPLAAVLKGTETNAPAFAVPNLSQQPASAAHQPPRGEFNSLCKNFASTSVL